jgi:SAM-dependent methyltransferase
MFRDIVIATTLVSFNLAGIGVAPSFAQSPHTHQHSFSGAQHWARVFDDPARDEWQKPHEVIQALNLAPGSVVADIGSGTGYFSIRLAHFVPKGRVFGVDTEPDMVKYLVDRAKRDGLTNVTAVAGRPDDARLPAKVDLVLMVDVHHHIAGREQYFRRLQNSLKPGGRVAIIDYRKDSPMGPPASERITADAVRAELRAAGYALVKEHDFLPHQYFLIFRIAKP